MKKQEFNTTAGRIKRIGYDTLFDLLPKSEAKLSGPYQIHVDMLIKPNNFFGGSGFDTTIPDSAPNFIRIPRTLLTIPNKENFMESQIRSYQKYYNHLPMIASNLETVVEETGVASLENFGDPKYFILNNGVMFTIDISTMEIVYTVDEKTLQVYATLVNTQPLKTVMVRIEEK